MPRPVSTGLRQDQSFTPNAPVSAAGPDELWNISRAAGYGGVGSATMPPDLRTSPISSRPTPDLRTSPVRSSPSAPFDPQSRVQTPPSFQPTRPSMPSVIKVELPSTAGGGGIWKAGRVEGINLNAPLTAMQKAGMADLTESGMTGIDIESAAFNVARGFPVTVTNQGLAETIQRRAMLMKQQGYTSPTGERVEPINGVRVSESSYYHPEVLAKYRGQVPGVSTPIPYTGPGGGPGNVPGFGSLEDFFRANPLARLQYNSAADQIARSYDEAGRQADSYFSREGRIGSPAHAAEQRKVDRDKTSAILSAQRQVIQDFADQQVTPGQQLQANLEREKMALEERMGLTEIKSRETQVAAQAKAQEDSASLGMLEAWMKENAANERAYLQSQTQLATSRESTYRSLTATDINATQRDVAARLRAQGVTETNAARTANSMAKLGLDTRKLDEGMLLKWAELQERRTSNVAEEDLKGLDLEMRDLISQRQQSGQISALEAQNLRATLDRENKLEMQQRVFDQQEGMKFLDAFLDADARKDASSLTVNNALAVEAVRAKNQLERAGMSYLTKAIPAARDAAERKVMQSGLTPGTPEFDDALKANFQVELSEFTDTYAKQRQAYQSSLLRDIGR